MRGMLGRYCHFLPGSSLSTCSRALVSLGILILLVVANGFLPATGFAERFSVHVSPDAINRALSEHQQFLENRHAAASSQDKPAPVSFVAEVLLPPDTRLVDTQGAVDARVVGTGWFHGYSIGHVSLTLEQAEAWQNGARLELVTEPLAQPAARARRLLPRQALDARRAVQARVVNPGAVSRYLENSIVLKSASSSGFSPTQQPSLDGSAVEMLIVTRETLRPAFEVYAEQRTRFGTPTVVRTVEWIRQNYPQGADVQEMIRGFVREAYELWGIRYLLIGGDSGVIPARFAHSIASAENPLVPTDLYYSCLDGSWNADGDALWGEGFDTSTGESDTADLYPEVFVGRVPVTSETEVYQYLAKLQSYLDPQILDFQGRMLFMGEVIWPANYSPNASIFKNGADNAERIISLNGLDDGSLQLTKLYETPGFYQGSEQLTRARAQQEMDTGYGLVTHVGHGFRYTMSLGDASLTNVQATF